MKTQKKQKINLWKRATIVLGIIALLLILQNTYQIQSFDKQELDIDGIKVNRQDLCAIYSVAGLERGMQLCDIDSKICTREIKLLKNPCE